MDDFGVHVLTTTFKSTSLTLPVNRLYKNRKPIPHTASTLSSSVPPPVTSNVVIDSGC